MNTKRAIFLFALLLWITVEILADGIIVKLKHGGEVTGSILKSQQGKTIYAFRGIPYAEPPTGALRFKPPVRKSSWSGEPLDATKDGPICPQVDMFSPNFQGQEDCLYLNVYTTKPANTSSMAVMVFIHGGGFRFGSSITAFYGPGLLLDEDVILVTMNYRLGPLGFLSTGDSASPGNYGLMDQSLALQWIRQNVDAFGGDPNKVTIFGESAGGASVGFHLLSEISEGLFQAAIAQSGTALSYWALQRNPLQLAKSLAAQFQCPTESTAEMVECLREIPDADLAMSSLAGAFVPSVDGTFLTATPEEILTSGNINNVTYLSGVNKDEGLLVYVPLYMRTNMKNAKQNVENLLNAQFGNEATTLIMKKYFSNINWENEDITRQAIVKMVTDGLYNMPHYKMLQQLAQKGFTTYAYSLDYASSVGFASNFGIKENWGVCHADDLAYLFDGDKWWLKNATTDDKKIIKAFTFLWTNFAKYSNPTPITTSDVPLKWKTSTASEIEVYHIDNPITLTTYNPDKDDVYHFWTDLLEKKIILTV